jgi:hypothetical protein
MSDSDRSVIERITKKKYSYGYKPFLINLDISVHK